MPFFDIESEGQWFYFDPANEALGGVCLRVPTAEETARIEQLTVTVKKRFKRGVWREDKKTDTELASKLMWDFCIVDWKEVVLEKDAVSSKCSAENKARAVKNWEFLRFVNERIDEMMEANTALDEARAKNLESLSNENVKNQPAKNA